MIVDVTIHYLEMLSPTEHRRARAPDRPWSLERVEPADGAINRRFYEEVGREWHWTDRLVWSPEEWHNYASTPGIETWLLRVDGVEAGYFELDARTDEVEIVYFGLLPGFIGHGWGGHLLSSASDRGWALDPRRVWVHTCTLDHPAALPAYQARGFHHYRDEKTQAQLRDSV